MADHAVTPSREIVTRAEARAAGLKRYYTGKPCLRAGHIEERYAGNGECAQCVRDRANRKRAENPEKARESCRRSFQRRYNEDPEYRRSVNDRNNKRYHENKHLWKLNTPVVERARERARKWFKEQHKGDSEWVQKRRADKRAEHHRKKSDPEYVQKRLDRNRRLRECDNYRARERENKREWARNNPEAVRADAHKRRAALQNAEGFHTAADIANILKLQKHRCAYCAADLRKGYHVDHIMPLILGGSNWPSNLQGLCPPCNLSKGPKDPLDFAKEKGRLL